MNGLSHFRLNERSFSVLKWSLVALGIFLSFWKLGQGDVEDWDEARRGMNALGMIEMNDSWRLHYAGEPDNWSAKPPLSIWAIVASYKIFGFNAFALRFHSALSISLFFLLLALVLSRYFEKRMSLFVLAMAIGMNGYIGFHVGRTGDTDAMLLLFLTAGLFAFLESLRSDKAYQLLLSSFFFGLAFYTKGAAVLLFLPALVLSALVIKPLWLKGKGLIYLAFSVGLFFAISGSWVLIQYLFGHQDLQTSEISTGSGFKQMFWFDVVRRFGDPEFSAWKQNYWALFPALDTMMGPFVYLFYGTLIWSAYRLFRTKWRLSWAFLIQNPLLLVSVFQIVVISFIYSASADKHRWYLAPFILFYLIVIGFGLKRLFLLKSWLQIPVVGLIAIMVIQRFISINSPDQGVQKSIYSVENEIAVVDTVYFTRQPRQSHFLYMAWIKGSSMEFSQLRTGEIGRIQPKVLYLHHDNTIPSDSYDLLCSIGNYSLLKRNE